jgi:hypothetical protein
MTLLVEDTARNNLASWSADAIQRDFALGAVITPFTTPRRNTSYKQSGERTVERVRDAGGEAWFDPLTHALQMPNVGDFRYYEDWDLWAGNRNALETSADQRDHVSRVFAIQDGLGVPHLAPTILLHSAQSSTSQHALDLAQAAIAEDSNCRLSIAGDSAFWSAGNALDAHIGALAQLEPAGWFISTVRGLAVLPVPSAIEEVHGLCRTARALSEDGPVHVSHGDFAALPAVVAGAHTVGTGWDPRQRVCAYASYAERDAGDGGQWFQQVTMQGLLSLLPRRDAELLATRDSNLANRLLTGAVPPGPSEKFFHHADVLSGLVGQLRGGGSAAYQTLSGLYQQARLDWATVATTLGITSQANAWIGAVSSGLESFAATENW